jgi:excisionase family DNA binding protein
MLTAAEAAKLLGLSARTMYDLAKAGRVKCYRMGLGAGAVRFDPADLEEYKRTCQSSVTTPAAGCISSAVQLPGSDSALTSFFRKAGRGPKQSDSTSRKRRDKLPLRLVSDSDST